MIDYKEAREIAIDYLGMDSITVKDYGNAWLVTDLTMFGCLGDGSYFIHKETGEIYSLDEYKAMKWGDNDE